LGGVSSSSVAPAALSEVVVGVRDVELFLGRCGASLKSLVARRLRARYLAKVLARSAIRCVGPGSVTTGL
jgi:hypothetical protein